MNRLVGRGSPYMMFPKRLPDPMRDALSAGTYQITPGSQGAPMARLDLRFLPTLPVVTNPAMALALLLDRSGSMTHVYRDGHVFNAASAVLDAVSGPGGAGAGAGFDVAFYDSRPSYGGHVSDAATLRSVIDANAPRGGGTMVSEALRDTIAHYKGKKQGVYVVVVTDGEFADKTQVERLVLDELLPRITPENPNAIRLHFIGAGEEVDHEFLKRLEAEAAGRGVPLVRQHHHAHLRHSHTSIVDELDAVYIGVGRDARLEGAPDVLTRASLLSGPGAERWQDGPVYNLPFLPRRVAIGLEYASPHPATLDARLTYTGAGDATHELPLSVPLPAAGRRGAAAPDPDDARGRRFHLPWHNPSAEKGAEEQAHQAALVATQQARQAELDRQAADLQELARGGIPAAARQRLRELAAEPEGTFTSDLAPDELGLLRQRGYRSRGLVTGSCLYHVGLAYASAYQDSQVRELSGAYNAATALAVSRMEQEVRLLGAHGAIGVRVTMARHEWAEGTVEVGIVGTAVTGPDPAPAKPWLSDLSGQEWWALQRAGYEAAALVWGNCTWFVLTKPGDEQIKRSYANVEFTHQSNGLAQARKIALAHLTKQAKAARAHGVTGIHLSRRIDEVRLSGSEYEHHTIVLSIIGTAIRLRKDAPRAVVATRPILSLRDGRLTPVVMHNDARFE